MKCKQEASCECLTWSPPSDSCLSWTRDEPSGVVEASLWQQHTKQMGPLASTLSTRTSRVSTSLPTTEDVWLVGGMNMGSRAGTGIRRNNRQRASSEADPVRSHTRLPKPCCNLQDRVLAKTLTQRTQSDTSCPGSWGPSHFRGLEPHVAGRSGLSTPGYCPSRLSDSRKRPISLQRRSHCGFAWRTEASSRNG